MAIGLRGDGYITPHWSRVHSITLLPTHTNNSNNNAFAGFICFSNTGVNVQKNKELYNIYTKTFFFCPFFLENLIVSKISHSYAQNIKMIQMK